MFGMDVLMALTLFAPVQQCTVNVDHYTSSARIELVLDKKVRQKVRVFRGSKKVRTLRTSQGKAVWKQKRLTKTYRYKVVTKGCNKTYKITKKPIMNSYERRVFTLTNQKRSVGRMCANTWYAPAAPVRQNAILTKAARLHSQDMARRNYFAHRNPDGLEPWDRGARLGYDYYRYGENIAAGQKTPEQVVDAWIKSPKHCEVLMTKGFKELGVGYVKSTGSKYGTYWTQNFGTRR